MTGSNQKSSTFSHALLWFGAAISIAEIFTGALIAPLGIKSGISAILIGHVIGAAILFPAGMIGARTQFSSAESVSISFGTYGSKVFSLLNILQLLGWTAIMIINGAKAFNGITCRIWGLQNETLWSVLIGLLICLWVTIGIKNLSKVNWVVISALFIFTIILGFTVFGSQGAAVQTNGSMSFGGGVELSVAMSLSWLPLISDYTRNLKNPVAGTFFSVLSYFAGSSFMFIIGLGAAIYAGTSDVTTILLSAGLGAIALFIVLFSTVTTTFLDVYSAGVCSKILWSRIDEKSGALAACLIGTLMAILIPVSQYENFLYLIGSVFAPLFAIMFTDYFICGKNNIFRKYPFNIANSILWLLGFIAYRMLLPFNSPVGITLPIMLTTGCASFIINKITNKRKV